MFPPPLTTNFNTIPLAEATKKQDMQLNNSSPFPIIESRENTQNFNPLSSSNNSSSNFSAGTKRFCIINQSASLNSSKMSNSNIEENKVRMHIKNPLEKENNFIIDSAPSCCRCKSNTVIELKLDCKHNLCLSCLREMIETTANNQFYYDINNEYYGLSLKCPDCNKDIQKESYASYE